MKRIIAVRGYSLAFMLTTAFVSYQSFTTPIPTGRPPDQETLFSQVPTAIPGPPPTATSVDEGEALAYIQIPRFGNTWLWTVIEGTSMTDLKRGPGHYSDSPLPGEDGNSAYAAHRNGHGDPFLDFEELRVGDDVIIRQNGAEWTYDIKTKPEVIEAGDRTVLAPKAGKWLTLTTCWPKYGSEKRMYIHAELVKTE